MDKPLAGKKILVPRSKKQTGGMAAFIAEYGGEAVEIPLLAFKYRPLAESIKQHLGNQDKSYDWIIFTSSNGVKAFFQEVSDIEQIYLPKIASIGEITTAALNKLGYQTDFVPSSYVAEAFVEEFIPIIKEDERILLVKGNLAREYVSTRLKHTHAILEEAILYETYFPKSSEAQIATRLDKQELDVLLFTSSSTVDHFMDIVKKYQLMEQTKQCIIVCIGPITKERVEYYGLKVHVTPEIYTVASMIVALVKYYKQKKIGE